MLNLPRKMVVFDIECTTWEGAAARNWSGSGECRELVQIGAVLLRTRNFKELGVFQTLVKPKLNPILSDHFINLTHITQAEVNERGLVFPLVLEDFYRWCGNAELYCFDKIGISRLFDRDVLIENCEMWGVEFPFEMEQFHNINEIFFSHGYVVEQSGAAPKAFGLEIPARPHNALNDVRGLTLALRALKARS